MSAFSLNKSMYLRGGEWYSVVMALGLDDGRSTDNPIIADPRGAEIVCCNTARP